ncbi:UNVERIFIED_CONTAM: hypothetical protein Slati_0913000 [Sesamum latifolium]|uniref:Integrase catalytic domain-containing protein n=1 Tax=Sesamum latifolium TaxID=2727402 RepID=A0AAW2XQ58_9LAMI
MADQLAKLTSSNQFVERRRITLLTAARSPIEPEDNNEMDEVFLGENTSLPWTTPIVRFLREGTLPEDHKEARKKHANHLHNPATFMKTMESPCPFDMWGMDIVGKLPRATGQREYLIVAVDYFTKWVGAEPLAKISEKEVIKFIWQNLICQFGIPRALVTDNGTSKEES